MSEAGHDRRAFILDLSASSMPLKVSKMELTLRCLTEGSNSIKFHIATNGSYSDSKPSSAVLVGFIVFCFATAGVKCEVVAG